MNKLAHYSPANSFAVAIGAVLAAITFLEYKHLASKRLAPASAHHGRIQGSLDYHTVNSSHGKPRSQLRGRRSGSIAGSG